jgi:GTPase Era involved in 16S rRNA processing
MKNIFIKYNAYKLETLIKIDGNNLAQNSELGEKSGVGSRLQQWVEDLPRILLDEYNDIEYKVEFHGTLPDYEDLKGVLEEATQNGIITSCEIKHIPAKQTYDKENEIDAVFEVIKKGPFDELRSPEVISAFNLAKSDNFEVCVVATMSAGKSTLINAMLGTKLLPAKQEACTAIITRIKDICQENGSFKAEVFDKNGKKIQEYDPVSYPDMVRLNSDQTVSLVQLSGNIPFVSAEEVSLVLIDTPGPNNSRDERHKKVQSEFLGNSSKALVLYVMTGEYGTDDDNALLRRVSDSMAVGGKQSKDRFIFVVNKLDDRKKEDGDTKETLDKVRLYLKTHGIANPNLFPAAALPALNLRLLKNQDQLDLNDYDLEEMKEETETKVKKLNRNKTLHFETFADLLPSLSAEIKDNLKTARSHWEESGKPVNENPEEALIHSGVTAIELAIRQYVQKYAKTAKVKNIVDTFIHKLEELNSVENTKKEIIERKEDSDRISKQIDEIQMKIHSAENAVKFQTNVANTVKRVDAESQKIVEGLIKKFQGKVSKRIDLLRDRELEISDAEYEVERLKSFAHDLDKEFEVDLEQHIHQNLVKTSNFLLAQYKNKLTSLMSELGNISGINIDPLKLIGGSLVLTKFNAKRFAQEKEVEDGQEYVKNYSKAWYKPWTWFQEEGYYRTKYKKVKCVEGSQVADEFLTNVIQYLEDNGKSAVKYAKKQSLKISESFNVETKRLDEVLSNKLSELRSYATDRKNAEERLKESEEKLKWLEGIKAQVESILEI